MTAEALLPVGRDCECGCPLVWRQGHQWCAVYGSHRWDPPDETIMHYWNRRAPYAGLVQLCMDAPGDRSRLRPRRAA